MFAIFRIQEEREERHKFKHNPTSAASNSNSNAASSSSNATVSSNAAQSSAATATPLALQESGLAGELPSREGGSYDTGDPNTTNLYLGNLNPKVDSFFFYFSKSDKSRGKKP